MGRNDWKEEEKNRIKSEIKTLLYKEIEDYKNMLTFSDDDYDTMYRAIKGLEVIHEMLENEHVNPFIYKSLEN